MLRYRSKQSGVALLMALSILTLLSVLGISFATSMRTAEQTARNFFYEMQVRYLAEAGVQYAIAQLKYGTEGARVSAIDDTNEGWYSGYSDTSLLSTLGSYNVSIIDCASRIYLSDGNPNLAQLLKNLRTVLGAPLTDGDCDNIASNAPYFTKDWIKTVSGIDDAKYNAIKDYVAIHAYVDPYVIDPQDISTPYSSQPRAPVNVNTASQQVLEAVLTGIKADHACPKCGGDGIWTAAYAGHYTCDACGGSGKLEITSTEAGNLANFIINDASYKRPYPTWDEFYSSINSCASIGEEEVDVVIANCNPDTGFSWVRNVAWDEKLGALGKYAIDRDKNGVINSSDVGLTSNTTEFSFNSGGYYEIQSTGELRNSSGVIVATKGIQTAVRIFDIFRQTTQAQFDQGTKSNIQSYPEPVEAGISSAQYSGQLALDTLDYNAPSSGTHFRANYRTDLNSPISAAGMPTIGSVASPSNRGELLPDGMLVDYYDDVRPKYLAGDHVSENEGTIIIWFKPLYPGWDSNIYSGSATPDDQDRKMYRFTSNTDIYGNPGISSNVPHSTLWFWSDYKKLWVGARRGGGRWNIGTGTWSFPQGFWYFRNSDSSLGFPCWEKGAWQQLVVSWVHPYYVDPVTGECIYCPKGYPEGTYNSTNNPISVYSNGANKTNNTYYYHTPYADRWGPGLDDRVIHMAHEYGFWWGQMELLNAVIGSVRIYDEKLLDANIQADYLSGVYEISGTYTSSSLDPDVGNVEWGTITWTEAIPSGGDLVFNIDTGSGWEGNVGDPADDNSIQDITSNPEGSSLSYRVTFSSGATTLDTPILGDVTITYLGPTEILYWSEK